MSFEKHVVTYSVPHDRWDNFYQSALPCCTSLTLGGYMGIPVKKVIEDKIESYHLGRSMYVIVYLLLDIEILNLKKSKCFKLKDEREKSIN